MSNLKKICNSNQPNESILQKTEYRLAGFPLKLGFSNSFPVGFAWLRGLGLAFAGLTLLSGCLVQENRYSAADQSFSFTFFSAPKGTVCDATGVAGVVERGESFMGAPRVLVSGAPATAVVTCTLPDGRAYRTNIASQLPFGAYRKIDATAVFSPLYDALQVDVAASGVKQSFGNSMVRVK